MLAPIRGQVAEVQRLRNDLHCLFRDAKDLRSVFELIGFLIGLRTLAVSHVAAALRCLDARVTASLRCSAKDRHLTHSTEKAGQQLAYLTLPYLTLPYPSLAYLSSA